MTTPLPPFRLSSSPARRQRGSVLVTALLIATTLGVGLVGYLALSNTALKLSQRTLFVSDAGNLAEAGLEEALYGFNQLNAGVAPATAWSGWTISDSTARRTLPQFNRDQNGVGTVKVFVDGYDSGAADPFVIAQATITPFDGSAPIVKILRIGMMQAGVFINGVVGLNGLTLKGQPVIDSFNSNPSNSPTGPWITYSPAISASNTSVIVKAGAIDLGNGLVKGNVALGAGVAPPPAARSRARSRPTIRGSSICRLIRRRPESRRATRSVPRFPRSCRWRVTCRPPTAATIISSLAPRSRTRRSRRAPT